MCLQHTLAEVWVQKTSEMDSSHQYHCRTFLGHLLNIGDLVLGSVYMLLYTELIQKTSKYIDCNTLLFLYLSFDFANANINDEFLNKMNPHHVPDVVRPSSLFITCTCALQEQYKYSSPKKCFKPF